MSEQTLQSTQNSLSHYIELAIVNDGENSFPALLSTIFQNLHFIIKDFNGRIGIGFAKYKNNARFKTVGNTIRIFGNKEDVFLFLDKLKHNREINNYSIYSDVLKVPQNVKHYFFQKISRIYNNEKTSPTIFVNSSSTKCLVPLNIARAFSVKEEKEGKFNSYGLSYSVKNNNSKFKPRTTPFF